MKTMSRVKPIATFPCRMLAWMSGANVSKRALFCSMRDAGVEHPAKIMALINMQTAAAEKSFMMEVPSVDGVTLLRRDRFSEQEMDMKRAPDGGMLANMKWVFAAVWMWAGWLAVAGDLAPSSFETYAIVFADIEAAEQAAKAIIGDEGTVTVDAPNHRLLVVTTRDRHAQLAGMIQKLNAPPKNVRVDVQFKGASFDRDSGAGFDVQGGIVRDAGLSHTMIHVQPRLSDASLRTSTDVTQSLLVASGREGLLHVGEEVPHLEWLMGYARRWGYVRSQVSWQTVGSYLVVQPTVVGEGPLVRIRLTPELSGTVGGRVYRTRFARVATEVVVQDGQAFQIGGLDQDQEFYSRFLSGLERGGTQRSLEIYLTPRILSPGAPGF
jgi:hypothetical protein